MKIVVAGESNSSGITEYKLIELQGSLDTRDLPLSNLSLGLFTIHNNVSSLINTMNNYQVSLLLVLPIVIIIVVIILIIVIIIIIILIIIIIIIILIITIMTINMIIYS